MASTAIASLAIALFFAQRKLLRPWFSRAHVFIKQFAMDSCSSPTKMHISFHVNRSQT
jgi:hypothetical protein